MRWDQVGKEAEEFLAFPVLAALSRRPLTSRELCHVLRLGGSAVTRRTNFLEKHGFIVRRSGDQRWVMVVRLMAMGVSDPPGDTPVTGRVTLREVVLGPQEPVGREQVEAEGSVGAEESAEGSESLIGPAKKLALRFGVPEILPMKGEVTLARITPCQKCGKSTPLRYGEIRVCAGCARLWGSVGKKMEDSDVPNETWGSDNEAAGGVPTGAVPGVGDRDVYPDGGGAGDEGGEGGGAGRGV